MEEKKKMKKGKKILLWTSVLCGLFLAAFGIYVSIYYKARETSKQLLYGNELVAVKKVGTGLFLDGPGETDAVIFYPGAKVEYTAYIPIWFQVASEGVDVFIVNMPCNLAIFGQNLGENIQRAYSYENWYMAGHSLGGAMAAEYVSKHLEEYQGLILLAAYPTKELFSDDFRVLSIYGSEDHVLNWEHFEKARCYMPSDYQEVCITGGNHGQFGDYGYQKKDGNPIITKEEQWNITVDEIMKYIRK